MNDTILQFLFFIEVMIFLSVVFFQLVKKNKSLVILYMVQSVMVSSMLFAMSFYESSFGLFVTAIVMLLVKVLVAPMFFFKMINDKKIESSSNAYLSAPVTLFALMLIVILVNSSVFMPLVYLSKETQQVVPIALSSILASIFLTINRRGAISQIVGILSLENSIISFASLIGIKQTLGLELGIMFDISVWIAIAVIFASMVHKHFGSLNISEIKHLKD